MNNIVLNNIIRDRVNGLDKEMREGIESNVQIFKGMTLDEFISKIGEYTPEHILDHMTLRELINILFLFQDTISGIFDIEVFNSYPIFYDGEGNNLNYSVDFVAENGINTFIKKILQVDFKKNEESDVVQDVINKYIENIPSKVEAIEIVHTGLKLENNCWENNNKFLSAYRFVKKNNEFVYVK